MQDDPGNLDPIWRALSDPTRRQILDLLRERPRTVGELAESFADDLSRFAVMKHLGVLKEARLVIDRKEGRVVWNHINAVPLRQIYDRWVSRYESLWAGALLDIKRLAEDQGTASMPDSAGSRTSPTRIALELNVNVARDRVFKAFAEHITEWWPREDDNVGVLRFESKVGGQLVSDAGNGRGVLLATVTRYDPPRVISLRGALSDNDDSDGVLRIELTEAPGGTLLSLSYTDLAASAGSHEVPNLIFNAFRAFIERDHRFAA